jgi:hypothetical protein
MPRVSVHLYDLTTESRTDIAALLGRIAHTPKARRWRRFMGGDVALLDTRHMAAQGIWLLDFVKRREVGPGKLRVSGDIESFEFRAGENFGEETAALIDMERGWMAVQWNLHGVRPQSTAEYLNVYEPDEVGDFILTPKLDPRVVERLRRKDHLRVAEIKVKLTNEVTRVMRDSGMGLGEALVRAGRESETATLAVELNMSRQAGFLRGSVAALCAGLAALGGDDVKTVKIKAREGDVGQDEIIDMLEERITAKYSSDDLDVVGGRYTQDSRWRSLMRLHTGWRQDLRG